MEKIRCSNCNNELMKIQRGDCEKCEYNTCYNSYNDICNIDNVFCRGKDYECKNYCSGVDEGNECEFGQVGCIGCEIITCSRCDKIKVINPFFEE